MSEEAEEREKPAESEKSSAITRVVAGATLEEALTNLASGIKIEEEAMAQKEEELLLGGQMKIDEILQEWEEKQKVHADAIEEQKKKDEQIAELQAKLLKSDLQKKATASLEKDGYPVGLAELLDYTSEEAMEKSLSKLTDTFKGSLQAAVESRLRGKTPAGLGNAASAENMLRDQIARNIRGL